MRNKITFYLTLLTLLFTISSNSFAIKDSKKKNHTESFTKHKSHVLKNINLERSILDKMESCVKSASNKEGIVECYHAKEGVTKEARSKQIQELEADLQNMLEGSEDADIESLLKKIKKEYPQPK
jgi:single-stranded DNA-specific DHH superfamily exonuclease